MTEKETRARKIAGLPPYNVPHNTCWNDAYAAKAFERDYGETVDQYVKRAALK